MLLGMFIMFVVMSGGAGILLWLAWCRLGEHLKENDEAVSALTRHLLIPLMGTREKQDEPPQS